jgi:hypothetical protein
VEAAFKERYGAIKDLQAEQDKKEKAQAAVVKNLEKKISQMHRAARDQENLVQELQAEIARWDGFEKQILSSSCPSRYSTHVTGENMRCDIRKTAE